MNYKILITFFWGLVSCQQPNTNSMQIHSQADTLLQSAIKNIEEKDSIILDNEPITCKKKGILVERFEQNDAQFERLKNTQEDLQWLKVTMKAGRCFIIDSIMVGNQYVSSFEDWDKDGFKDRIYWLKWTYQVHLFDKRKNDFSRKIKGDFNGKQWDFDKERYLKFQFLEDKFGGNFQLYQLQDTLFKVISEIRFIREDSPKKSKIEIRKNIVRTIEKMTCDILKMDNTLYNALQEKSNESYEQWLKRTNNHVKTYWNNNLSLFIDE